MKPRRTHGPESLFTGKTLSAAVMSVFALPGWAIAQDDDAIRELTRPASEIEFGLGHVSKDSFKFGDYTGLEDEGGYLIGNIDLIGRPDPLSGSARYWSLTGTNLGLTSRNLRLQYGIQGNYKFSFEYDQLPKLRTDSARTVFNGAGGTNLTLPAGWAAITAADAANTTAATAARAAKINPFLQRIDVEHERKNYKLGFSKFLSQTLEIKADFRHETKEGTKITGAVIGNSGGNPRSVLIPEPIDYVTNEFEATLAYSTAVAQFQVGYHLSLFNDRNASLMWQNPYAAIGGWAAAAGFPTGQGQLGLPPDNQFHQLSASAGYNLAERTRLTANLALGRMTQDEPFLPYTVNPALAVTTPLPRASLDGRIDTTVLNLNLTSRPMPKLNLRASYRYDDRDNKTPQAQYVYIGGDSTTQVVCPTPLDTCVSDRVRRNLPISSTQNQLKLAADYAVLPRTKLNVGYDYETIKRTFEEVGKTKEHTYHVGVRRGFSQDISGGLTWAHSKRDGSTYLGNGPYLASYSPAFTGPQAATGTQFDNHPLLRKFTMADRERDKVRFSVNAAPHERVALQFRADFNQDDYKNSILGLTDTRSQSYTLDASVTPQQNVTAYAYYTRDNYESNQKGRAFTAANKAAEATPLTSTQDWLQTADDRIDTIGLGFKIAGIRGRLDLGAEYTYSHATGKINVITGAAIAPAGQPLPDLVSQVNSLRLYGKYKLRKNATLNLTFVHEKLKTADWAYDNVASSTMPLVIGTGQLAPNYSVNVIGVSLSYRYW